MLMFCTWFYSTMAHIWKKYTEFIARKNGSLVTVLFGCDSLFVCSVRYGVTEFRWEGHSGVYLQDTFMTPSSVLYLPYIKNWKNKNICLTKLYVIFFINFWCNKYISTLLKKNRHCWWKHHKCLLYDVIYQVNARYAINTKSEDIEGRQIQSNNQFIIIYARVSLKKAVSQLINPLI